MIRPILRYGAPILHRRADPVVPDDGEVPGLVADMLDTLRAARGVGLAAPQVGVPKRLFIVDVSAGSRPESVIVLLNPEFSMREGLQLEEEGCLSVPGFEATVARPARVTVHGLGPDGGRRTIDGDGLLARALQHEMDHLNGILFIDRLRPIRRRLILRRIEARRRSGGW